MAASEKDVINNVGGNATSIHTSGVPNVKVVTDVVDCYFEELNDDDKYMY